MDLPDVCLRGEFLEQTATLRSKILKKVRAKRIKGRPLDGEMFLELIHSYLDVVNRGELPDFELT